MKLLVAVDFSDPTEMILKVAKRMATSLNAPVALVHAAEPEPDFVGYDAGPEVVRGQVAKEMRDEHRKLQALADKLRDEGVDVTALLVQGPTVETVLATAKKQGSDLIIVGSHGFGAVYDLLVGSISRGLIKDSPIPVLVVPVRED